MARRPLIALADDLTGAAEVAAIAHEAGLKAVVVTKVPRTPVEADVLVFDTDTRLLTPAQAARRVRTAMTRLLALPHAGVFKKTDSVLRGPVLAEAQACAQVLGLRRIILVAGNPSLDRVIRDGRCTIAGQPIHETAFARDPHHPALSSSVLNLLHAADDPDVRAIPPETKPLPATGVIVGDHRSASDTTRWAAAVDKHTLPAGAADFFRAWLRLHAPKRKRPAAGGDPASPALLLHGTTASPIAEGTILFNGLRAPPAVRVAAALRHQGSIAVAATPFTLNDPLAPAVVAEEFAKLTRELSATGAFRHLLIAGGATSATVLHALGWNRLEVVRIWAPGVVSLRPDDAPDFTVTLKPGSYPWPDAIRVALSRVFS